MKKKVGIAIGIVAIIAILFGVNIWRNAEANNVTMEVTSVKQEKISETVMTPGTLKLADQQNIYFTPEKGEIDEYYVKEGDDVEAGTPLLRYENEQLDLEKKQNELQRQSSQMQLNSLEDQLKDYNDQLKDDKENKMLKAERDGVNLQVKQAKLEIEQIQLQKKSIDRQIADLVVKSDMGGKVVSINKEAAVASASMEAKPLIQIGTLNELIVEGALSEYDTLKIKEGQSVELRSDAMPGESWKGKVNFIAYLPNQENGLQAETGVQYPIEVTVDDQNISLKPGFQMVMEIITEERETKTLPLTAVKQEDDKNYVFTVVDGKAKKQDVKVGIVTNENIEIVDGLTGKEKVLLEPGKDVKSGMDVTVK